MISIWDRRAWLPTQKPPSSCKAENLGERDPSATPSPQDSQAEELLSHVSFCEAIVGWNLCLLLEADAAGAPNETWKMTPCSTTKATS